MGEEFQAQLQAFAQLLREEYNKHVGKEIGRGHAVPSQTDFAKWLGVPQVSLSNWINGVRPPNRENMDQLATKLGTRVYDIFGMPHYMPKDRLARQVMERWHALSDSQRREIEERTANFIEDNEAKRKPSGGNNPSPA
jgi:transcriptional regulator with XRE-family HTH domain